MPRFCANLSILYPERPFLERFAQAAADGFRAVEYLSPEDYTAAEIKARLDAHGLEQVLFNAAIGDYAGGERGLASLPGREDDFRRGIARALDYAGVFGNRLLHVMAGLAVPGISRERQRETYVSNLAHAAREAAASGVTVLVEPINPRDMPGYFLNRQDEAHALVRDVGAENLRVQMDLYHCQVVEGDLASKIRQYLPGVAHVQVAGVPGRNEPDTGEVNYPYLFGLLDELGYAGWIGCEYRPRAGTSEGLAWASPWLRPGAG